MPGLRRSEIVVVGGGPAGATAAAILAGAGRDVVLLERGRGEVEKVCGEFLSREVLAAMRRIGIEAADLGAVPITHARLSAGSASCRAPLPFAAAGLSRSTLDRALLGAAEAAGAEVLTGHSVRRIEETGRGATVTLDDGRAMSAETVLVATGKTDLPGERRDTRWPGRGAMIGVKMHLGLDPGAAARLGSTVELHLFDGGCAGLQPVDRGANLCISLTGDGYRGADAFARLLDRISAENAVFASALAGADRLSGRPLSIARVPYGFCRRPAEGGSARRFWLGDQIAVTASFTGDGLALAMESARAAAETILAGGTRAAYEAAFRRRALRQIRRAMLLQALVDRPGLHRTAVAVASWRPGIMGAFARLTRLPSAAMR